MLRRSRSTKRRSWNGGEKEKKVENLDAREGRGGGVRGGGGGRETDDGEGRRGWRG